jgi:flavin reductase (DIM6/NTAB) family NADH-FMN oxidoreductase RutF
MHHEMNPAILYFGTPVVLVSSTNEDGSPNLAPMSSAWWLGDNAMLGFGRRSKTPQNILRTGECVLNLPSAAMADVVDRLALTTGSSPVPPHKVAMGYRHERDKLVALEVTIVRVHVHESIRMAGHEQRIDPDRWRPLIMSFCRFYGLGPQVRPSTLAQVPESSYRPGSRAAMPSRGHAAGAPLARASAGR